MNLSKERPFNPCSSDLTPLEVIFYAAAKTFDVGEGEGCSLFNELRK